MHPTNPCRFPIAQLAPAQTGWYCPTGSGWHHTTGPGPMAGTMKFSQSFSSKRLLGGRKEGKLKDRGVDKGMVAGGWEGGKGEQL